MLEAVYGGDPSFIVVANEYLKMAPRLESDADGLIKRLKV